MRIGLTGGASTVEGIVQQAVQAEADGFHSLWYASNVAGDPLVPMALAGRETNHIELGTAVLQTYPCHPALQAARAVSVSATMNRPGFTLGVGPSHRPLVEHVLGLSYAHPGRNTEEYLRILGPLLRGEDVDVSGDEWSAHVAGIGVTPEHPVPTLVAALGPRLLRVAGELADGTICWMAPTRAIAEHVTPAVQAAAAAAGRPSPRVVAGLPVAVHDDEGQARAAVAATATVYAGMPNYQRILDLGGADSPAAAALVGGESSVTAQLQSLIDAGATDIWAQIVPVGSDRAARSASRRRTYELLADLAARSLGPR